MVPQDSQARLWIMPRSWRKPKRNTEMHCEVQKLNRMRESSRFWKLPRRPNCSKYWATANVWLNIMWRTEQSAPLFCQKPNRLELFAIWLRPPKLIRCLDAFDTTFVE